jgi:energy-converting hydrogenase Eha subunit A
LIDLLSLNLLKSFSGLLRIHQALFVVRKHTLSGITAAMESKSIRKSIDAVPAIPSTVLNSVFVNGIYQVFVHLICGVEIDKKKSIDAIPAILSAMLQQYVCSCGIYQFFVHLASLQLWSRNR